MAATETTDLPLGFKAPDFSLPNATVEGMVHAKDVFVGRPTVVVFMCNHCPFVIHLLESFVAFAADCKPRGVDVVAISSNDVVNYPQDGFGYMQALAQRQGFTFPYLYDESQEVARAYDAACTPDFSVYDQDSKCVYRGQYDGSRPGNDIDVSGDDLRRVVNTLLAGEYVPEAGQMPSLGCNIKWKG